MPAAEGIGTTIDGPFTVNARRLTDQDGFRALEAPARSDIVHI
jgi:hypothetical protein